MIWPDALHASDIFITHILNAGVSEGAGGLHQATTATLRCQVYWNSMACKMCHESYGCKDDLARINEDSQASISYICRHVLVVQSITAGSGGREGGGGVLIEIPESI